LGSEVVRKEIGKKVGTYSINTQKGNEINFAFQLANTQSKFTQEFAGDLNRWKKVCVE